MFLERRVYQGSSGRVYPLPFVDRIATEAQDRSWQAVHVENEFVRVMVLPELGGRIHVAMDRTNGYDFVYRQNVIKPALVGLAGPWVSGGIEFNWPQHHRPATFMPLDFQIEDHADGSKTIWCSDHDPTQRLKGMHGVCLHPGKARIELKVRLYNRTSLVQTFLWWANVGVHVHEQYQSFFPPDVHHVADHAKRAMSRFPLCEGVYYGVDYGERAAHGVPADERPQHFVPPGNYAANDLSWYANIPVPTSYMALGSKEDFSGGYDHKRGAGLIHVANHHIAPGKKQWTWGNHQFGYAWDRNLTDHDGPYIELMAGVFTDNQPDFSFLAPGETKTFSQHWYPIRDIGPAQKANTEAAIGVAVSGRTARVGVHVTESLRAAGVRVHTSGQVLLDTTADLTPASPLVASVELPPGISATDVTVVLRTAEGREVLRYAPSPEPQSEREIPLPATPPPSPREVDSNDELYVVGLHLEQYRHATRSPDGYWLEALRRDPGDSRCNNAMGLWYLRRGEFDRAEQFFRRAIDRLTQRNPNPRDGEAFYNLGLALRYLGRDSDAYDSLYKATWSQSWSSAASLALAEIDAGRGDWTVALQHVTASLRTNTDSLNARNLAVVVLRELNRNEEAEGLLRETLSLDPMDSWARHLANGPPPRDNHIRLDLALDHARSGLYARAAEILAGANLEAGDGSVPMVLYALGYFHQKVGDRAAAEAAYSEGAKAAPDYCFPSRLEELIILQAVIAGHPEDARAPYYLGNLLYDRRRHEEALRLWEQSARLQPAYSVVWRNLGIGYFNVEHDVGLALSAFDTAVAAAPTDARILYERDQLWKRTGEGPARRLTELEQRPKLVRLRDDLSVELASLYNQTQQHAAALALIRSRRFQPWEGGEGLALGQHVRTHLALGRAALADGHPAEAGRFFEAALNPPDNLGEVHHPLANRSDIYYWLGRAAEAAGEIATARIWWERAARHQGDFQEMSVRSFSEMTYYNALALRRLDRGGEAEAVLRSLLAYAEGLIEQRVDIDYFATSLPAMLLFEDDLQARNTVTATVLQAQACLGLGDTAQAQRLLQRALQMDGNHAVATDLLAEMELPAAL